PLPRCGWWTTCRSSPPRGSPAPAAAAPPGPRAGAACAPGRSACRGSRGPRRSARPPDRSSGRPERLELAAKLLQLGRVPALLLALGVHQVRRRPVDEPGVGELPPRTLQLGLRLRDLLLDP